MYRLLEEQDMVKEVFGYVGACISTIFFISPVVPYLKLIREEIKVSETPGVLLICNFFNCLLWKNYGLLLDLTQVIVANGVGGAITLIFITIFLIHIVDRKFWYSFLLTLGLMAAVAGFDFLFYLLVPADIIGNIAFGFNILIYAAPGEKLWTVIKTGNYNLIPIYSTLAGIVSSVSWMIYGIYLNDWRIYVPNGLGIVFSIIQIIIYLIYKKKSKNQSDEEEKPKMVETEENNEQKE